MRFVSQKELLRRKDKHLAKGESREGKKTTELQECATDDWALSVQTVIFSCEDMCSCSLGTQWDCRQYHTFWNHTAKPIITPKTYSTRGFFKAKKKKLLWNCWRWRKQHLQADRSPCTCVALHFISNKWEVMPDQSYWQKQGTRETIKNWWKNGGRKTQIALLK